MKSEKILNELEERSLEKMLTSDEFKEFKDGLHYSWEPSVRDVTEQDVQDYLW